MSQALIQLQRPVRSSVEDKRRLHVCPGLSHPAECVAKVCFMSVSSLGSLFLHEKTSSHLEVSELQL